MTPPSVKTEVILSTRKHIKSFPSTLAAIVSFSLIFEISYEIGFYYILDFRFFSLLTTNDILRNSVSWLPFFGVIFLLSTYINFNFDYLDPQNEHAPSKRAFLALSVGTLAIAIGYAFLVPTDADSAALILISFALFFMSYLARRRRKRFSPNTIIMSIIFVAMMYSATKGAMDAYRTLQPSIGAFIIRTTATEAARLGNVIKLMEKGVLFVAADRGVEFAPWDDVKELRRPIVPLRPIGLMRWWSTAHPPHP